MQLLPVSLCCCKAPSTSSLSRSLSHRLEWVLVRSFFPLLLSSFLFWDPLCCGRGMPLRGACPQPPLLVSAPSQLLWRFNNSGILGGWFEGMQCPYSCDPGVRLLWGSFCPLHALLCRMPNALLSSAQAFMASPPLCAWRPRVDSLQLSLWSPVQDGGYNVSGRCAPVSCGQPSRLPEAGQCRKKGAHSDSKCALPLPRNLCRCEATARMDDMKAAASRNFTFGVHVRYACDRPMLLVHHRRIGGFRFGRTQSACGLVLGREDLLLQL